VSPIRRRRKPQRPCTKTTSAKGNSQFSRRSELFSPARDEEGMGEYRQNRLQLWLRDDTPHRGGVLCVLSITAWLCLLVWPGRRGVKANAKINGKNETKPVDLRLLVRRRARQHSEPAGCAWRVKDKFCIRFESVASLFSSRHDPAAGRALSFLVGCAGRGGCSVSRIAGGEKVLQKATQSVQTETVKR
jgi:hypothetical protein